MSDPRRRAPTAFFRLTAGQDGNLVLPRHVLEALGAAPDEVLVGMAQPGETLGAGTRPGPHPGR